MALAIPTLIGLVALTVLRQIKASAAQLRARRPCPRFDIGNTRDRGRPGLRDLLKPRGALREHLGKGAGLLHPLRVGVPP